MLPPVPEIVTDRLILRGHRLDDLADCEALWGDPEVVRYISGQPSTPEDTWARVLRLVGHWSVMGFGYWVVRERDGGGFVGQVGLADFRRELEPSFEGAPEAGWVLSPRVHGLGYATEAVGAALAWADRALEAPRIVCLIHPDNRASLAVAERSGFSEYARTTYKGEPTVLLERRK